MHLTIDTLESHVRLRQQLPAPLERKAIRQRARIGQAELAELIGVTPSAVASWESGARVPKGPNRDRYVRALAAMQAGAE